MGERLGPSDLYDAIVVTLGNIVDRKRYIQEVLIKKMDGKKGRISPQEGEEVARKLFSVDVSKPGEAVEIIEESVRARGQLTSELALEIADVVYYALQPNCPEWVRDVRPFVTQFLGVDIETAYAFCILKYELRLLYGDLRDYKEVEKEVMARFLKDLLPA